MTHHFTIACILLLAITVNSFDLPKFDEIFNVQKKKQKPFNILKHIQQDVTPTQESLPKNTSDTSNNQRPSNSPNATYMECFQNAVGYTAVATAVGGGATAAVGSTAALSAVGFTSSGVAAGSIAAGVHSAIAVVEAGSIFAYLQSAAAMTTGVFGAAFLPVTIGVGAVAGSGYLYSQCGLPF